MNTSCHPCRGLGIVQRSGNATRTGQPYDLVCAQCNGRGYIITGTAGPRTTRRYGR